MIKREQPAHPLQRETREDGARHLLLAITRYAATFELMLSAWRDRSLYEAVRDELEVVAAGQKALFPEAGVAMMGLSMAHSDIVAALLEGQVAHSRGQVPRHGPEEISRRRARHEAAVEELRGYILRKTH